MSKHTPGKWKFEGKNINDDFIISKKRYPIAFIYNSGKDEDEESQECLANAELIAKAPDMYELLKALEFSKVESADDYGPFGDTILHCCPICDTDDPNHKSDCKLGNLLKELEG